MHGGVFGCRKHVRWHPGEPLVEVQGYLPVAAAGEQRVRQGTLLYLLQQRRKQPGGAETVQESSHLVIIAAHQKLPAGAPWRSSATMIWGAFCLSNMAFQ